MHIEQNKSIDQEWNQEETNKNIEVTDIDQDWRNSVDQDWRQ